MFGGKLKNAAGRLRLLRLSTRTAKSLFRLRASSPYIATERVVVAQTRFLTLAFYIATFFPHIAWRITHSRGAANYIACESSKTLQKRFSSSPNRPPPPPLTTADQPCFNGVYVNSTTSITSRTTAGRSSQVLAGSLARFAFPALLLPLLLLKHSERQLEFLPCKLIITWKDGKL